MDESLHPACWPVARLLESCRERRQRRSGPGGQHRNKVETAVVLTHVPTGSQGEASERRSQEQNRQRALFRLRVNLALHVRTSPASTPSPRWASRLRAGRIAVDPAHEDFPALLAEALDVLAEAEWELRPAAARLECTATQLAKLLRLEPRAWLRLNEERRQQGLRPLK